MAATRPLCLVCSETEGKYKCPRCGAFTCSVPCFREHRDNHPPIEEKQPPPDDGAETAGDAGSQPDGGLAATTSDGPFSGLADQPEYQMLMKRYPRLPTLLWGIATATDPPAAANNNSAPKHNLPGFNASKKDKEPWTQEKGVQNAVQVLRKTRLSPGDDSDALREFSELVRLFKARKEEQGTTPIFRKKFAQDSAEVIEQLMRKEKASAM